VLKVEEAPSVYLYAQPCDMRCGFDRLAELARAVTNSSVLQGGLFVFVSRDRNRVKILYWDRDGYALWYKRLEAGVFRVEFNNGVEELRGVDLKLLLEGLELSRIKMRRDAERGVYA
jgi:transposase